MNMDKVAEGHLNKMVEAMERELVNKILPLEFNFELGNIAVNLKINPGSETIVVTAKKWLPSDGLKGHDKKHLQTVLDLKSAAPIGAGAEPTMVPFRDFDADKADLGMRNRERSEDLT